MKPPLHDLCCLNCGYDVRGMFSGSQHCPECGGKVDLERLAADHRERRRLRTRIQLLCMGHFAVTAWILLGLIPYWRSGLAARDFGLGFAGSTLAYPLSGAFWWYCTRSLVLVYPFVPVLMALGIAFFTWMRRYRAFARRSVVAAIVAAWCLACVPQLFFFFWARTITRWAD